MIAAIPASVISVIARWASGLSDTGPLLHVGYQPVGLVVEGGRLGEHVPYHDRLTADRPFDLQVDGQHDQHRGEQENRPVQRLADGDGERFEVGRGVGHIILIAFSFVSAPPLP
jgi:hypothetical protein